VSRLRRAADRIREEVSLAQVLQDYGYEVYPEYGEREQQFSCDLHGDGSDNTPSARYYPESEQFFCFACGQSRDSIALVREKEGLSFWQAVKKLEKSYGLQPLPWEPPEEERTTKTVVAEALDATITAEQMIERTERLLLLTTQERSLPPTSCAKLWEAYDKTRLSYEAGGQQAQVRVIMHKIIHTTKEALRKTRSPDGPVRSVRGTK
jgi:hypothetical protein